MRILPGRLWRCSATLQVKIFLAFVYCCLLVALVPSGCGPVSFGQYSRTPLTGATGADQRNGDSAEASAQGSGLDSSENRPERGSDTGFRVEVKCAATLPAQSLFQSTAIEHISNEKSGPDSMPVNLNIPRLCHWNETVAFAPVQNLKVWLVLDVSGSMRPNIDQVREGIAQLLEIYQAKGWRLEVGAIAFTDAIDAIIPPTQDIDELLKKTSDNSEAWKVYPSRGQDTPESGLAAIGCALSMAYLGSQECSKKAIEAAELGTLPTLLGNQTRVLDSHWILYVSDAPARNSAFEFDTLRLSQSMHDLGDLIHKSGAELRFYAATKDDHKGLLPHWPVPLDQLKEVTKFGSVPFQEMRFPVTQETVEETFLAQARIVPNEERSHECVLEEIGQIAPSGLKFNVIRISETESSAVSFQAVNTVGIDSGNPVSNVQRNTAQDSPAAEIQVYIQRKCGESGMRTFEKVGL